MIYELRILEVLGSILRSQITACLSIYYATESTEEISMELVLNYLENKLSDKFSVGLASYIRNV
jgi:hypothetical protein